MDDRLVWNAAFSLYDRDKVMEAYELVQEVSIGPLGIYLNASRLIEGEALTRRVSEQIKLKEWLTLELVPPEIGEEIHALCDVAEEACGFVAQHLAWRPTPETNILLTIMAREVDGTWALNPYGYFIQKEGIGKICLPYTATQNPIEFREAVAHEFAHAVSSELSDGRAPRWINEAISVLLESRGNRHYVSMLRQAGAEWLDPSQLEATLSQGVTRPKTKKTLPPYFPELYDDESTSIGHREVVNAYLQCGLLGQVLRETNTQASLGDLLRAYVAPRAGANWLQSSIQHVMGLLLGKSPTSLALKRVYGLDEEQLFEKAQARLLAG